MFQQTVTEHQQVIGISTSGKSENIVRALQEPQKYNLEASQIEENSSVYHVISLLS
jgi:phosphoheptose isomerase